MSEDLNRIEGTIMIGNPALVVKVPDEVLDAAAIKASLLPNETRRPFAYGDPNDPSLIGNSVKVIQGGCAIILEVLVDEPLTLEEFAAVCEKIRTISPKVTHVGTIREDHVPVISPDYETMMVGDLCLMATKKLPVPDVEEEEPDVRKGEP
jgi:hypothetical protein